MSELRNRIFSGFFLAVVFVLSALHLPDVFFWGLLLAAFACIMWEWSSVVQCIEKQKIRITSVPFPVLSPWAPIYTLSSYIQGYSVHYLVFWLWLISFVIVSSALWKTKLCKKSIKNQ